MKKEIYKYIKDFLPLNIELFNYDWITLILSGKEWKLEIKGSWRLIDKENFLSGNVDEYVLDALEKLRNAQIIDINAQSRDYTGDFCLYFSTGDILEVFSLNRDQSWQFQLANNEIVDGSLVFSK